MLTHLHIARLANRAYREKSGCVGEIEYLVEHMAGVTVIAYRGTEAGKLFSGRGWRDVLRDIRFLPWFDKRVGWAHSGFLWGAKRACRDILKAKLSGPVVLTGHSLGAALALCSGPILRDAGVDVRDVILFGSPRALTNGAADDYPINVTSYRYGHDFVTTIPSGLWGYKHPVELTQLGNFAKPRNWSDHSMDRYVMALFINER